VQETATDLDQILVLVSIWDALHQKEFLACKEITSTTDAIVDYPCC
jgi:hypothetical protein